MDKIYQTDFSGEKKRDAELKSFSMTAKEKSLSMKAFKRDLDMTNKYKRGFTLIELLVVVLIIGVLAAVALPQYEKAVWKSRSTALQVWAGKLLEAQNRYYMSNGHYTQCLNLLDIDYRGAFSHIVKQEDTWWDGGAQVKGCVMSVSDGKSPGVTISVEYYFIRVVFTSGKYMQNGFGTYLNLAQDQRQMGGLAGTCPSYGDHGEWRKILKSMGYSKQVVGNYACYQQFNRQ